ncbi:MAG: hypothetical protein EXQ85_04530 [Alphaproteobacteria bacterium]|nr:hypothetical protein [Alphaproteobacteria bacterium]
MAITDGARQSVAAPLHPARRWGSLLRGRLPAAVAVTLTLVACSGDDRSSLAQLDGAVGILGTITEIDNVTINGFTIAFDRPVIRIEEAPASAGDLRVGHVVAVEARSVAGQLSAVRAAVQFEVSGPVTAIERDGRLLRVLGQTVYVDPDRVARQGGGAVAADLRVGHWLDVSGLRDADGVIVASRLDRRPADGAVSTRGSIDENDGTRLRMGSLVLIAPSTVPVAGNRPIRAVGSLRDDGTMAVVALEAEPPIPFGGRIATISIEGFVRGPLAAGGFTIGPREIRFAAANVGRELDLSPGRRVHVLGRPAADSGILAIQVRAADPNLPASPPAELLPRRDGTGS